MCGMASLGGSGMNTLLEHLSTDLISPQRNTMIAAVTSHMFTIVSV